VSGRNALCARVKPDIKVRVERSGDDPLILFVNESWLDVVIVEDSASAGFWRILAIYETLEEERTPTGLKDVGVATENTTWGCIKALFR
jgi:hypothetical protein